MIGWSGSAMMVRKVPVLWLLELGADQVDVLRRIEEAVRRAVQRDEALAAGDVVEQGLFLLGRDLVDVGVDDQAVVGSQGLRD